VFACSSSLLDDASGTPARTKEFPDIIDQLIRPLPRSEMPSTLMHLPKPQIPQTRSPVFRQPCNDIEGFLGGKGGLDTPGNAIKFLWKDGNSKGNTNVRGTCIVDVVCFLVDPESARNHANPVNLPSDRPTICGFTMTQVIISSSVQG
jgi:hypothetical protein